MLRRGLFNRGSPSVRALTGDTLQSASVAEAVSTGNSDQQQQDLEAQKVQNANNAIGNDTLGEADTAIAQAWMAKRREQMQSGGLSATAVDVDAVVGETSWDPPIPQSSDYLSTKRVTFSDFDAESSLSSHSIRTDKTPIASNRVPGARPRTKRPLLYPHHPVSPNHALPPIQQDLSCRDVFDIKKWHGKVLYALIFLLFVSIITVIATATLTGGRSSNDSKSPAGVGDVMSQDGTSLTPSISPSLDSDSGVGLEAPTVPGSLSPTFSVVTPITSPPLPTKMPTMQVPIVVTVLPPENTSAPMLSIPEEPAIAPVSSPQTSRPTTNSPSLSPAPTLSVAPSTKPSLSPSLSLPGLSNSLKESFRFDHRASSVAISNDAKVIAISDTDSVFVYARNGETWQEIDAIPSGDNSKVAVNYDGSVIAISFPNETAPGGQRFSGLVRVYLRDVNQPYRLLGQELEVGSENAFFGAGLALSFTGRTIAIGAPFFSTSSQRRVGQARVYEYSSARNRWVALGAPLFGNNAEDWFGSTLTLQEPGFDQPLIVAVSAPHSTTRSGYVQTYALRDIEWTQYGGRFTINNEDASGDIPSAITDNFGLSLSMVKTEASLRMAVGAPQKYSERGQENTGMVVVYDYDRTLDQWILLGDPLVEQIGDKQGTDVALVKGGKLLIVGSPGYRENRGVARFYRYDGTGFPTLDGAEIEGNLPQGLFGSAVSATTGIGTSSMLSLVVSATERSEIVLMEGKA